MTDFCVISTESCQLGETIVIQDMNLPYCLIFLVNIGTGKPITHMWASFTSNTDQNRPLCYESMRIAEDGDRDRNHQVYAPQGPKTGSHKTCETSLLSKEPSTITHPSIRRSSKYSSVVDIPKPASTPPLPHIRHAPNRHSFFLTRAPIHPLTPKNQN